jgi:hypothetical protein
MSVQDQHADHARRPQLTVDASTPFEPFVGGTASKDVPSGRRAQTRGSRQEVNHQGDRVQWMGFGQRCGVYDGLRALKRDRAYEVTTYRDEEEDENGGDEMRMNVDYSSVS